MFDYGIGYTLYTTQNARQSPLAHSQSHHRLTISRAPRPVAGLSALWSAHLRVRTAHMLARVLSWGADPGSISHRDGTTIAKVSFSVSRIPNLVTRDHTLIINTARTVRSSRNHCKSLV